MNPEAAKQILLRYRPGSADRDDPEIVAALALAASQPELGRWLEEHCARQMVLQDKFRDIPVPAGLKEQIISEQAARHRQARQRPRLVLVAAFAVLLFTGLVAIWWQHVPAEATLTIYQNRMVGLALRGYGMDLTNNNQAQIRTFLLHQQAPSDFVLPPTLQKATVVGCGSEGWQDVKVAMLCFRTGKPLHLAIKVTYGCLSWTAPLSGASPPGKPRKSKK